MDTETEVSFESVAPSMVRSIKQRDLLNTWLRAYAACNGVPHFQAFQPERMEDEIPDLVFYRVEHHAGRPTITIASDRTRLSDVYGRRGTGEELATYLGAHHAKHVMPIYHACIARALPAYSISQVSDISGVKVDYERLLLPFSGERSGTIAHVLASLKTISEDGSFVLRNLMRGSETMPVYRLYGIIDRDLVHNRPIRGMPADGDVVELG